MNPNTIQGRRSQCGHVCIYFLAILSLYNGAILHGGASQGQGEKNGGRGQTKALKETEKEKEGKQSEGHRGVGAGGGRE